MSKLDPSAKDYYKRLGLEKNCGFNDIRKAFKKCVMKFHPDRVSENKKEAEEKFKRCNEAYEVLKDEQKRQIYDKYGEEGLKQGMGGGGGFDPFGGGFFGNFFGGGGGQRQQQTGPKKTQSVKRVLQVTLDDVYNGKVRKIRVTRKRLCKSCKGRGSTVSSAVVKCTECKGKGQVVMIQRLGPGFVSKRVAVCPKCRGEGTMIDPKHKCKTCTGQMIVEEKKQLEVHIDKGMREGQKIEFEGEADEKPGYKPGDIIFVLQIVPHKTFKRKGLDLIMKKKINLTKALTGVEFIVEHMDGRILHVKSKKGDVIKPGMVKQIEGEGFPRYKTPYEKGNLHVHFEIIFPTQIPKSMQEKLIGMLPEKGKGTKVKKEKGEDEKFEEVLLENVSAGASTSNGYKRREAYDEDEEGEGRDGKQFVSCSIQ